MSMTRAYLKIDQTALLHNFHWIRNKVGGAKILAVIKGNAYGHGLVPIAKSLPMADGFGVATLSEAVQLREAGIHQKILLMSGVATQTELKEASKHQFDLVVHHEDQLKMLSYASPMRPVHVWVKINTGMNRLGFRPKDLSDVMGRLNRCVAVHANPILMTHFACADEPERKATLVQYELLHAMPIASKHACSYANSAGIMAWPQSHADWVRPGKILYGISPMRDAQSDSQVLKPVMGFFARLIAINLVRRGEFVGYGGLWRCPTDRMIGIVSAGYGDGYPRDVEGAEVWIEGDRYRIVGLVSMDMMAVDLGHADHLKMGDEVELWGRHVSVDEVADWSSRSSYELLCAVSARVDRLLINEVHRA